ncbi:putative serine dehydratase domain-containing protein [Cercophora newfieldiana]|uniref:Serine dehydratase domain-containing protein n=1 Tax=Cercophora newfieldiana TaxID=92897 RepID=A0AA40D221_9PEZI|nr:putative serine dehydratase domain-containing protein [Cercophora newfieldiana]
MTQPSDSAALKAQLRDRFVGQNLNNVPTPSIVLDLAKLEVNCERMLDATERLGLLWRVHIKTHKTTELTRLQVGNARTTPVSLMTSTVLEAENITPLLQEYQSAGRKTNVLLAFPVFPSAVPRLARISSHLGPSSLSLMIDHPSQLPLVATITSTPVPGSPACSALIDAILQAEAAGTCVFHGIYCHAGHSYGARHDWEAMHYLAAEFAGLHGVAGEIRRKSPGHELVLSVGATPTATSIQHPTFLSESKETGDEATREVERLFNELKGDGFKLEVHAGVYPTLDLQQLATHARDSSLMTSSDIAVTVLAEVASVYPTRGASSTTEALLAAGALALGREPVTDKGATPGTDYSAWGILAPWGAARANPIPGPDFPRAHSGWQVGRISQEHGILTWRGPKAEEAPLRVGDKVRVWPNHSCVAGACFDYYLVVDSRRAGREDEVVDVWPRWRGW